MKILLRAKATTFLFLLLVYGASLADGLVLEAGTIPPDRLGRVNGEDVLVSDHSGQVLIITFWATWCGPCMKELPVLNAIQRQAGVERVRVIAINLKESRAQFRKTTRVLKDYEITFMHDERGNIARRYGVRGIPNLFIIDVDGTIAHRHVGYGDDALRGIVAEINALMVKNKLYGSG